jgi:hypothetical protein
MPRRGSFNSSGKTSGRVRTTEAKGAVGKRTSSIAPKVLAAMRAQKRG